MKIIQIYRDYGVPKNLWEHMLRTAALAKIILEKWTGPEVNKNAVVRACAVHDIAKPMNFNLRKQSRFGIKQEEILKLKKLQEKLKSKYGNKEHPAAVKICEEAGFDREVIRLVDNLEWENLGVLIEKNDLPALLTIYCDMRIGPKGILSVEERHKELVGREMVNGYKKRVKNGKKLEKIIQEKTGAELNKVTDDQLDRWFEKLISLEI